MNWSLFDFVVAAGLIGGAATAIYLTFRFSANAGHRTASIVAALGVFMLLWINGAVGIVGSENNPLNLAFIAMVGLGGLRALLGRFSARAMMQALVMMALCQILIAVAAIITASGKSGPVWPYDIIVITLGFTTIWLFAAHLYRRADAAAQAHLSAR